MFVRSTFAWSYDSGSTRDQWHICWARVGCAAGREVWLRRSRIGVDSPCDCQAMIKENTVEDMVSELPATLFTAVRSIAQSQKHSPRTSSEWICPIDTRLSSRFPSHTIPLITRFLRHWSPPNRIWSCSYASWRTSEPRPGPLCGSTVTQSGRLSFPKHVPHLDQVNAKDSADRHDRQQVNRKVHLTRQLRCGTSTDVGGKMCTVSGL